MRRNIPIKEKLEVLEEARQPKASPSEICRRHQISLSLLYYWQRKAQEAIAKALEPQKRGRSNGKNYVEEQLRNKIVKMQAVISEITAENLELKKNIGE